MAKKVKKLKNEETPKKVYLMQDTTLEYPELWMEVFIAGDIYEERAFAPMFAQAQCTRAESPDSADLVVFTGGEDVNPALYGQEPHETTSWSDARDKADIRLWEHCVDNGIPMLGVCRGMQFGHVMMGGSLFQDIDQHQGAHNMWDVRKKVMLGNVSSVHHQSVRIEGAKGVEVLADTYKAETRYLNPREKVSGMVPDIEAIWYKDVAFFGVQGHPEYKGYSRFTKWTLDMINELIIENPNIELVDNFRRIKEEYRVKSAVSNALKELA